MVNELCSKRESANKDVMNKANTLTNDGFDTRTRKVSFCEHLTIVAHAALITTIDWKISAQFTSLRLGALLRRTHYKILPDEIGLR